MLTRHNAPVPQMGELRIRTEFGTMSVPPLHICVVQRGLKFSVDVTSQAKGFVCEVFKGHFELPELGPIGANGLANAKDFQTPVAAYEDVAGQYTILNKFMGNFFQFEQVRRRWQLMQRRLSADTHAWAHKGPLAIRCRCLFG